MKAHARSPWLPLLALSAVLTAPSALAQRTEPPPADPPPAGDTTGAPTSRSFRDLDVNADGVLSKDEALVDAQLAKHFDKADKNGDGNLSEAEYDTSHHRSADSKY